MKAALRSARLLVRFVAAIFLMLFLIVAVELGLSAWHFGAWSGASRYAQPATAVDLTARFLAMHRNGKLDVAEAAAAFAGVRERLVGVRVIIVPSYLVDQLLGGRKIGLIDYFTDQERWLESLGVDVEFGDIDTEASVADNGRSLARQIVESDQRICFISHSKGSLDTLEALLSLSPEARSKIACWIALQGPFAGSPLADVAADTLLARYLVDGANRLLGGSRQVLDDLTTSIRQDSLAEDDLQIYEITRQVPILAVAAVLPESDYWIPTTLFQMTGALVMPDGLPSDGAVPTNSAILPHARFIIVEGLDHGDTVDGDRMFGAPVMDDVSFMKALFAIALGTIPDG